jgi:hypothetical protein
MRRHRIRMALAGPALALAVAVLAACGDGDTATSEVASVSGGAAAPTASGSAGATDPEQARKFAACMRENGVPDFPDPGPDGQFDMDQFRDSDLDQQKVQAARDACRDLAPNGGQPPQLDAAQQEQLRQFAQCMRDNGVDMPDPDPNSGGFGLGTGGQSFDRDDPAFQKALQACRDKLTFLPGAGS